MTTGPARPGRSRPRAARLGAAFALASLALGATVTAAAGSAVPAGTQKGASAGHLVRPAVTEAACLAAHDSIGWNGAFSGAERVGAPLTATVTFTCSGGPVAGPVAGVALTASSSPADLFKVEAPATVTTDAAGAATFRLVGATAGSGTVEFTLADRGSCAAAFGPSSCRFGFHVTVKAAAGLPPAHPGRTFGILPPNDPAHNGPAGPGASPACTSPAAGPTKGYNASLACGEVYVALINAQLAAEHAHAIHLPSDWARLTPQEQLFVMADLERVSRGLPPYVGLSASLDALAQAGAVADRDPAGPRSGYLAAGANWAGGSVSAAAADYGWVYVDGWGGPSGTGNLDCTSPHAPGCWGHRNNVLGRYTGLECTDCVMGAGAAFTTAESPSLTELFVEPSRAGQFPVFFTWAKDVLPYLSGTTAPPGASAPTSNRPGTAPAGRPDGILPPRHPARNAPFLVEVPPLGPCPPAGKGPAGRYNGSLACAQFYVAHINAARRLLGEAAVTPMRLPTNWSRLTPIEQVFVTADLERVDRHLPPYLGLSRTLDAAASAAAARAEDPSVPAGLALFAAGSNEFPGVVSAAEADYGWMYSDGVGGNVDCHAATDPGCWGHRDNILGRYTGLSCTDCVMGAGIGYPAGSSPALTELFVEPAHAGELPLYFTWAKDVVPYLKA